MTVVCILNVYTVEPLQCGQFGTIAVRPEYRGICIPEASGVFQEGMAMCTHVCMCVCVWFVCV